MKICLTMWNQNQNLNLVMNDHHQARQNQSLNKALQCDLNAKKEIGLFIFLHNIFGSTRSMHEM